MSYEHYATVPIHLSSPLASNWRCTISHTTSRAQDVKHSQLAHLNYDQLAQMTTPGFGIAFYCVFDSRADCNSLKQRPTSTQISDHWMEWDAVCVLRFPDFLWTSVPYLSIIPQENKLRCKQSLVPVFGYVHWCADYIPSLRRITVHIRFIIMLAGKPVGVLSPLG